MPEIRVDGIALRYDERGAGEAIVCIHGTGASAAVWGDAPARLARLGRAIAYDRRGSGRSDRPEPYVTDVREQADDAAALLDALAAVPAVAVGRSYGGQVAFDLALRYPDRVRALVLLEPALMTLTEPARRWHAAAARDVRSAAAANGRTVAETFLRLALGDASWEALPGPLRRVFEANGPAIVAEVTGAFPEVAEEELEAIAQPTLVVVARDSDPVFADVATRVADAIPSARLEWVDGGHLVNPAHPVVVGFVEAVLAAQPRGTRGARGSGPCRRRARSRRGRARK